MIDVTKINIPIFIITKDRINCLQQSLKSYYDNIGTPFHIVIHDNGSTYRPMLDYLDELEQQGIKIYRVENAVTTATDLNVVRASIVHYLQRNTSPYYVLTDPDIALDNTNSDILEYYVYLMQELKVNTIGPMLRIDDIPDYYPLKKAAIERHTAQFWSKNPIDISFKGKIFQYQPAAIDTSFGMYRRSYNFRRLTLGVRTYAPYAAKHLDWYLDPNNMTDDQKHYSRTASKFITHWSKL